MDQNEVTDNSLGSGETLTGGHNPLRMMQQVTLGYNVCCRRVGWGLQPPIHLSTPTCIRTHTVTTAASKTHVFTHLNSSVAHGPTNHWTDGCIDGPMDQREDAQTKPLVELRICN